jgi:hypothetical protein
LVFESEEVVEQASACCFSVITKGNRLSLFYADYLAAGAVALKSAVCEMMTIQRPLRLAIMKLE